MTEIVMALMWDKNALVGARFTHFGRAVCGMKNGKSKITDVPRRTVNLTRLDRNKLRRDGAIEPKIVAGCANRSDLMRR